MLTGEGLRSVALHVAVFAFAGAVLAAPTLSWPMTYDDLHLIRAFSPSEIGRAFFGRWDVDDIEVTGLRPLFVLFNHVRYACFGENVVAHRLFLVALYALFLGGLAAVVRTFGLTAPETLLAGVLCLCSRYSVYHYAFLTDGVHIAQGLCFVAALGGFLGWLRRARPSGLVLSLAGLLAGLLLREDTLAIVPVLWLLGVADARRGDRAAVKRLLGHAAGALALCAAVFAYRAHVVPDTPRAGWELAGLMVQASRAASLAGRESFDPLSKAAVTSWSFAPAVLAAGLWLLRRTGPGRMGLVWAACAVLACSPALVLRRENLLFFPVAFAALAYASVLVGTVRSRPRLWPLISILSAWAVVGEFYLSREFARVFHPQSSTSLRWSGDFVYGSQFQATIPEPRRRAVIERLAAAGIRSEEDFIHKLPRKIFSAEMEGRRAPTDDGRLFVPRLHFRAFRP